MQLAKSSDERIITFRDFLGLLARLTHIYM